MAEVSVLHWEDHQVETDTVDEAFIEAKRIYDELTARGGAVMSISIRPHPPTATLQYRLERDEDLI